MRLGIKHFFQGILSKISVYYDGACYLQVSDRHPIEKPSDFLSLGQIYEQGSCVVSRDLALAYAMYALSAHQAQKNLPHDRKIKH